LEAEARKTAYGGMLALAVAMGIGRFAFTPALALMQRDLGIDDAAAGQLAALNYAGYLAGALLAALIPTGSRRMPFLLSLGGSVVTTGGMALTPDPLVWSVLRFGSGLASAFLFVLASGMTLDSLKGDGRGAGLLYSGVGIGIALSGMLAGVGDVFGGWAGGWVVFGIAALLLSVPSAFLVQEPKKPERGELFGKTALSFGPLLASYFCAGMGYIVTGTFLVVIAERMPAVSGTGNLTWTVVGLAAIPSCLLWARLGALWGGSVALAVAYFVQAVGIVLPVFFGSVPAFLLSAILYGGTFMGIVLLSLTLGKLALPGDSGRAVGILTAVYGVGQILGPWLAGNIAQHFGSFTVPLVGAAGILVLGGTLVAISRLRRSATVL
jgi:MFS family permease